MSSKKDDKKIAVKTAHLLQVIAEKLRGDPSLDILEEMVNAIENIPVVKQKHVSECAHPIDINIFQIFLEEGEQSLREKLDSLDPPSLKKIIRQHSFDPTKRSNKWRKKERLVDHIITRVSERSEKGRAFEEY